MVSRLSVGRSSRTYHLALASFLVVATALLGGVMPASARAISHLVSPAVVASTPGLAPIAVSCASPTFCVALNRQPGIQTTSVYSTSWNGTRVSAPAKIAGASFQPLDGTGGLSALSCPSTNFCLAVGQAIEATTSYRLENGTWTPVAIPMPSPVVPTPSVKNPLPAPRGWTSIACLTTKWCVAVGTNLIYGYVGLVEKAYEATTFAKWNGSRWTRMGALQGVDLTAVSCASPTSCVAVGDSSAHWNGSRWSGARVPGETSDPATTTYYDGVSCPSTTACFASGTTRKSGATTGGSVIEWNGAWHAISHPLAAIVAFLPNDIACSSVSFCLSVGSLGQVAVTASAVSQWNGHTWTRATGLVGRGGAIIGFASPTYSLILVGTWNGTSTLWESEGAAATTTTTPTSKSNCSLALAKSLAQQPITPSTLRSAVNANSAVPGGGIALVTCVSVTGKEHDLEFDVSSGGSAGFLAWVVYRQTSSGWKLADWMSGTGPMPVGFLHGDLVVTVGVYEPQNPMCCPAGGYNHREYHWNGVRFVKVRTWHSATAAL